MFALLISSCSCHECE